MNQLSNNNNHSQGPNVNTTATLPAITAAAGSLVEFIGGGVGDTYGRSVSKLCVHRLVFHIPEENETPTSTLLHPWPIWSQ